MACVLVFVQKLTLIEYSFILSLAKPIYTFYKKQETPQRNVIRGLQIMKIVFNKLLHSPSL